MLFTGFFVFQIPTYHSHIAKLNLPECSHFIFIIQNSLSFITIQNQNIQVIEIE